MEKLAVITGANRGIGLETARQLAQGGVKVMIGARDPAQGEEAVETLRNDGLNAESLTIDFGVRSWSFNDSCRCYASPDTDRIVNVSSTS
jgi:NAD(P)-dependent dehydrogenase (short-subunit alcohol dehydrogenase family)